MPIDLTRVLDPALAGFDDIIDVRSPSEFAEDHLPGAINLPVLDDDERARVGTIYKQVSPFAARKVGAALVAANAARHISGPLADRPGSWRGLIYCWRGGQRSGSFATILAQIGWRVDVIRGGYKAWRRLVVERVQHDAIGAPVVVLDGNTGSAKTAILQRMAGQGAQVIDLEALARHRGSLFGAFADGQPGQKAFEGRLASVLDRLDPKHPVIVEAEGSRIGKLNLPKAIWRAICDAPRIRLHVPIDIRARYCARDYADLLSDPGLLHDRIIALSSLHPKERIEQWLALVQAGQAEALAEGLMRHHYDPRYDRHRARFATQRDADLDVADLADLDGIAAWVNAKAKQLVSWP
ncbi:tRNA 2-selenouridine(34) synthase MnmH [Paracoccus sp. Z330]|uniref:tRNA 2-selenouridine(34) synthase MnmH n=1 Tax=Paracoccus onchidii TaxID=3017813 RepID=A0ABT4ZBU9_9RHOB|nr:tRNA 2-selenouridine(34) synthase MnmH [Paracoccus onchidii]MDB6176846.1 tRNA 2-selenouridine(34) synthase MnmH [Paracoccus onchidii]